MHALPLPCTLNLSCLFNLLTHPLTITHTDVCTYMQLQSHTHPNTNKCTLLQYTHTYMQMHTCTNIYTHSQMQTHTHTHTHASTQTCAHERTQTLYICTKNRNIEAYETISPFHGYCQLLFSPSPIPTPDLNLDIAMLFPSSQFSRACGRETARGDQHRHLLWVGKSRQRTYPEDGYEHRMEPLL